MPSRIREIEKGGVNHVSENNIRLKRRGICCPLGIADFGVLRRRRAFLKDEQER